MTAEIEQIVRASMPHATLIKTWPLTGGISAHMTAFEVETSSSRRSYTLRRISDSQKARNPLAATHEYRLLGQLAAANLADLSYWDLLAALRTIKALAKMAPAHPQLGRDDITVETMSAYLRQSSSKP